MDFNNVTKESLPKEFQEYIERFNRLFLAGCGHSFEEDELFAYDMLCIRQALSFIEYYKDMSEDELDESLKGIESLYDAVERIKDKIPYYSHDHSGNSMHKSWQLFRCYRIRPDLVQYNHGCLADLGGDEMYYDDRSDIPGK